MRTLLLLPIGLLSCGDARPDYSPAATAVIVRPANGVQVPAGADLQAMVDRSAGGTTLCLAPGVHRGPVKIDKPLTLWGTRQAVVRTSGDGCTIAVDSDGVQLLGFSVRGSGDRFDLLDSAVRIRGCDVRIEGLRIEEALFGVLVEQSSRVTVRGNRVVGTGQKALGLRGDGIRLWETTESFVEDNFVTDCRDLVVWYSSNNRVAGNTVERSRYGTHFMYSHENEVEDNRYLDNVVGLFVMYSRDLAIRRNLLAKCSGAAGIGLGVKESGNLTVSDNVLLQNTIGVYLDTSPLNLDHFNTFERNVFRLSDTAVAFHSSAHRNSFLGNSFRDNADQVRVAGGGHALDVEWRGNDFDDYRGYDLDGDGTGDVPYELRSLTSELTSRYPNLAFFRGTPALGMVDLAAHVMPLFAPRKILVDPNPRMAALPIGLAHAR